MREAFFQVSGLCKSFGERPILRGVDLEILAGETVVILGGSGAGKSVLLKHLNGLIQPDDGVVAVAGEAIGALSERELSAVRRRIGILFQNGALFDSMTVGENVAFPLRELGERDREVLREKVAGALSRVDLAGEEEKMPSALSGGMRKRVALARAIVFEPRGLLCDEPTAGLDPILSASITELIRQMSESESLTSVVVTHHLGVMRAIADKVVFLKDGVVRFTGTPEEVDGADDEEFQRFLHADP